MSNFCTALISSYITSLVLDFWYFYYCMLHLPFLNKWHPRFVNLPNYFSFLYRNYISFGYLKEVFFYFLRIER